MIKVELADAVAYSAFHSKTPGPTRTVYACDAVIESKAEGWEGLQHLEVVSKRSRILTDRKDRLSALQSVNRGT